MYHSNCGPLYSLRPIFRGNRVFSHVDLLALTGMEIHAWSRSADDHIWPLTLHLDPSKVIRVNWPWLTPCIPMRLIWWFWGFLEVLRLNTWLLFHIDVVYNAPIHDVNQGHWTSLPSGDFAHEGDAVPLRGDMRHKHSINKLQRHIILFMIELERRWWKFYVDKAHVFFRYAQFM